MSEPMDAIFCRNVMIYFDKKTKAKLVERYANTLCDGGYLFIGHSESLFNLTDCFELIGNTVYRKRA
ncbi:MAG: chemotaxis protein CheR, partial [Gammaproteobacteria bacterium]|nr:chemotaxis protein CheR [Gammaproteobacteria bacterium]